MSKEADMPVFKSKEEMYGIFRAALEKAFRNEDFARRLSEAGIVMQYKYFEPEGSLFIDCTQLPIKWALGEKHSEPNVEFTLSGDTAHKFFMGRLSVPVAVATRSVVFKGQVTKALKLLPVIKPLYVSYCEALRELGREDLLEEEETKPDAKRPRRTGIFEFFSRAARVDFASANKLYRVGEVPLISGMAPVPRTETAKHRPPEGGNELYIAMLKKMLLIRKFEEHLAEAFADGKLPTFAVHLSIGQEAVAAGACMALKPDDIINTTHRGHGHLIAKGADVKAMMAELYGKNTGTCKGKGGSMHVIDTSIGIMGSNGIVGAGIVLGAGAALASSLLGDGRVSVVFFGDGAANQGMFHEGLNFAAVKKLPVVFILENNEYGEFTPLAEHSGIVELWKRAGAYGFEGLRINGNDARAVFREVHRAVEKARAGGGPTLIECMTYRWRGHMEGEGEGYRTPEEKQERMKQCPIQRLRRELENEGILAPGEFEKMEKRAQTLIDEAVQAALGAPDPAPDALYSDIYATDREECYAGELHLHAAAREITVSQAINETIAAEMRRDRTVILMGEDVSLGGYMSVTTGLVDEFGKERIIDTPISENAIVGGGVGAAAAGLRPIVEIMFTDFVTTCMDPIVNQAA
ncbi:MAG: thiamine pyrophosphate-dependent enzyme, partial [bacterium]